MNNDVPMWPKDRICMQPSSLDVASIAADIYQRTCRTGFDKPGFCAVSLGRSMDSVAFRQLMVDLKRAMAEIHEAKTGKSLAYLSAMRVDQQQTTCPHLDGGPDECFLMLGYEPSEVDSELEVSDYAKCAFDLGLSPDDFMARHNPMFQPGHELLRPYSTRLPCFSPIDYQIVCINNSSAPYSSEQPRWQGVLHTATILTPDESKRRVVNSTMIASVSHSSPEEVSDAQQRAFINASAVLRRGYDKPHLEDDP